MLREGAATKFRNWSMKKNVLASLFHCASNDEHPWHTYCPPGKDSWCGYMRDKALKTTSNKRGKGLPHDVTMTLKPVYATLSDETLLATVPGWKDGESE